MLVPFSKKTRKLKKMYSQLSMYIAARGSGTGFSLVHPAKVKAPKSLLFTKSSIVI